jgi:protein-S-isoprenylcysteine O-methyltransferase Ste14
MHDFLTVAFVGLGVFAVANFLEDLVPMLRRYHGFIMLALGIGAAYWMDYSMFTGWHIAVRNDTVGYLLTGFAFAGTTSVWRGILHWMGTSEGDEPESRQSHMRLAA